MNSPTLSDTHSPLAQQIRRRMAEIMGISVELLTDDTSVGDIPQWDSLTQMIMINSLESEFELPYSPDNMLKLNSVASIISYALQYADTPQASDTAEAKTPATDNALRERVRSRIAEMLGVAPEQLTDDTSVGDIPQWDSLMQMIMINSLESEFGIPYCQDNMLKLNTVGKIIEAVQRHTVEDTACPTIAQPEKPKTAAYTPEIPQIAAYDQQPIVQTIFERAAEQPAKTAIIFENEALTYHQLITGIRRAVTYLQQAGVKRGDVVALYAEKTRNFFFCYFGAHLMEAAVLNLDPAIKTERRDFIFEQTKPVLALGEGPGSSATFASLNLDTLEPASEIPYPSLEGVAEIMFTTGTTGSPKGVVLTHGNIAASASHINTFIGTHSGDIDAVALPVCHSFGIGRSRCVLAVGGTIVMTAPFSNAQKLLNTLRDYRVTGLSMVPAAWNYLQHVSGDLLATYAPHLRYIEIGGAPMQPEVRRHLMQLFPHTRVCIYYGLTEASRSTFMECNSESEHLDTVGRAAHGVEVMVCREDGTPCAAGEAGEICIRGRHVMRGYLHDTGSQTYRGDFFRSGDWGTMDEHGYVRICSRMKDMINVGGKKVSPEEVETVLNSIPGIADSACVAADDPQGILGEVVKAILVPQEGVSRPSDASILAEVDRRLEHYKVPVFLEWRSALVRTESGKLQRQLMK
ncbi:MAG: AMP-binding protein [Akkermansiaceae bacterium]|nr:AMP-binding protein [Akkermansiaceae bacterium]